MYFLFDTIFDKFFLIIFDMFCDRFFDTIS